RVLTNVAFYKGAVKAYETPLVEADQINVPDRKATAFELDVPLAELKPGFYTCQVNVVDDASGKFVFPRVALLVRRESSRKAGSHRRQTIQDLDELVHQCLTIHAKQ